MSALDVMIDVKERSQPTDSAADAAGSESCIQPSTGVR